jgi:4'-phosphopantetheinyl transferase EntD
VDRDKDGVPIWPEGVVGSISHCKEYSCACVAKVEDFLAVGVDIERQGRVKEEMRRVILVEGERQRFTASWQVDCIFSAKESFYKLLYPKGKTFFGFQDAEVVELTESFFTISLLRSLPGWKEGTLFRGEIKIFDNHLLTKIFHPACF